MKKMIIMTLIVCAALIVLAACGNDPAADTSAEADTAAEDRDADTEEEMKQKINIPQTGWTDSVPSGYLSAASEQGRVDRLDYESKDYAGSGADITKTAYVYTPYGYDQNDTDTEYDILYLMHGWGGHAGEYFEMANIRDIFDNMIEKGDIKPMIIVSATFYNEKSSGDFGSSVSELRAFWQDFRENLMPAVEGKYNTYAESASDSDLMASKDHRAFGGFSLGSVTTWLQLCYNYDYIRYYVPMSGSCWYYGGYGNFRFEDNVDFIEDLVEDNELDERGYFIYHAVGTRDGVKDQSIGMAEEMLSREAFTPDHYVFYQKSGGNHDHYAVREYLYNALPLLF